MNKSNRKIISTLLLGLITLVTTSIYSADKKERSFTTIEVAPGLYMLMSTGFIGGNLGLSIGEDGVVLIDDSMPPMMGIMKTAISSVTDKDVDFLINTHVHGDHTGNNESIGKSGTWIVAHQNLRQNMIDKGVQSRTGMVPAPKGATSGPVLQFFRERAQ